MLLGNAFSFHGIRIVTECRPYAELLPPLFDAAFGLAFDSAPDLDKPSGKLIFKISDKTKLTKIFDTIGTRQEGEIAVHLNLAVLEEECCRTAFLRGAFLSGGSVTDPEKKYHLEIITPHLNLSRELVALLLDMGLAPRHTVRRSVNVVYFKSSESIEDFLTTVRASASVIDFMQTKVEKDVRNLVNRKVNCETANLGKIVNASVQQCRAIEKIRDIKGLNSLPDKLRQTAEARLEFPEAPLIELAAMLGESVTRSGVNHRLRRLVEIASELGEDGAE